MLLIPFRLSLTCVLLLPTVFTVGQRQGANENENHGVSSNLRSSQRNQHVNRYHHDYGHHDQQKRDDNLIKDPNDLDRVDHDDLRYIVKYKNHIGRNSTLHIADKVHHYFDHDQYIVIDFPNQQELDKLRYDDNIESIEYDGIFTAQGYLEETILLDDIEEYLARSDHLHRDLQTGETIPYGITMTQATQLNVGKNRAMVCVVDTGINTTHPDFNPQLLSGANRVTSYGSTAYWNRDMRGHGTHITGTINAIPNNNLYVRGMGNIPVFMARGLDDNGNARESDIRDAMEQCESAGAKVISLSISGNSMTSLLQTLIDRLYTEKNILMVAASGNGGSSSPLYPASYKNVVSVGAVNSTEGVWGGSNYGPWLELTAPGTGIVSLGYTWLGQPSLKSYSGTSMATPHVAAAAAILLSYFPTCTPTQIRYALGYMAKDKGPLGCDNYYGYGIVQVKSAYNFLTQYPCHQKTNWGSDVGDGTCSIVLVNPLP